MIVVIPTNRSIDLSFLQPLIEFGARFIVVDDTAAGCVSINHPSFRVFTWEDRWRLLGKRENAIPKGNGACRDLGFYIAWKESDNEEIIVALDDDCQILDRDFPTKVCHYMDATERISISGKGDHFNYLELYENTLNPLYPRGFPYSERVKQNNWCFSGTTTRDSMFNLGLWQGGEVLPENDAS